MGLLKYARRIWVWGEWFFKRGWPKKTDQDSGRRERTGMQQLPLRVDSVEGRHTMLVIMNEGNDDALVDGVVLLAGCCTEHMATPHVHGARLLFEFEGAQLDLPIIDDPAVCHYPPAYDATDHPASSHQSSMPSRIIFSILFRACIAANWLARSWSHEHSTQVAASAVLDSQQTRSKNRLYTSSLTTAKFLPRQPPMFCFVRHEALARSSSSLQSYRVHPSISGSFVSDCIWWPGAS